MKLRITAALMFCIVAIVLLSSRCGQVTGPVNMDVTAKAFKTLSEYNFFVGKMKDLMPNEGVLPYELNTPLFTDYAFKARFVWMPEGVSAKYDDTQSFDFPVGAVLIKNFYYPDDFRDESKGRRIMETRLLVHTEKGWDARPYIWNDEQTDATLEVAGGRADISWIHFDGSNKGTDYVVPNKNQCKGCHEFAGKLTPIGPKAKNLNKEYGYADGAKNQLVKWAEMGYLTGSPAIEEAPRLAIWDDPSTGDVGQRARAWLDINCAHCHNAEGPANTSGLLLNVEVSDSTSMGICKTPVAAGRGSGNLTYDILAGEPDSSIIIYRMASVDPGIMMPELGRKMVHEEGLALVREWIESLDDKPCQ